MQIVFFLLLLAGYSWHLQRQLLPLKEKQNTKNKINKHLCVFVVLLLLFVFKA